MKITALETVRTASFPNLTFVVLRTDEGLTGLGETFYGADAVEAQLHAIVAPLLIGNDPLRRECLLRQITGYVGYAGTGVETRAASAVDLALWDLLGKATGQPVHTLLGGKVRNDIRIYNTCAGPGYVNKARGQAVSNWGLAIGRYEDLETSINRPGELALDLLEQGITGMKIWPFDRAAESSGGTEISVAELRAALEPIERIREAVGDDMSLMIELHALWDVPTARRIVAALEPYAPYWIEDPVRSDLRGGLARVAQSTSIRIAAGETVAGLAGFADLLHQEAIGVATVDPSWSGGLTVAHRVAALSAVHGIPIAPHDCTGPVALAACAHLAMSTPNTLIQETVRAGYLGWYPTLVEGGASIDHGRLTATDAPGLGIDLVGDLRTRPETTSRTSDARTVA